MNTFSILLRAVKDGLRGIRMMFFTGRRDRFGFIAPTARVYQPVMGGKDNVYLYDHTVIEEGSRFITSREGRFIMKRNSVASYNFTVITALHTMEVGDMPNASTGNYGKMIPQDVIVDEGVLIGAYATLLPGTHIPRGCIVGAGSVVTKTINFTPPYSVIAGNPARFIKFRFTLEQMLEHERICFAPEERIAEEKLRHLFEQHGKQ